MTHTPLVRAVALCWLAVLADGSAALGTQFAVLLDRDNRSADLKLAPDGDPERPLSILIDVPASALSGDRLLTLTYDMTLPPDVLIPSSGYFFGLTLSDPATGQLITQFSEPLSIQLEYPAGSSQADPAGKVLSYLDESLQPPIWTTQDAALTEKGGKTGETTYVCGETDHLTTFFLGSASAVPEPSTAVLLLAGAGLCARRGRRCGYEMR